MKRLEFELDGKTYYANKPSPKQLNEAKGMENRVFAHAVDNKALLRVQIKDMLKERGIWDERKEKELEVLDKNIREGEKKLKQGGFKKLDAKDLAFKIFGWRKDRINLLSDVNEYNNFCAESQADNANFDYLVSACVVDEEGNRVFSSYDDYQDRKTEAVAYVGAEKLATLIYGYDKDADRKLPETQFLLKYGYVNDDLRLTDPEGNLIDMSGRRVNNNGHYLREDGNYEDADGNVYDSEGKPIDEFVEFLD